MNEIQNYDAQYLLGETQWQQVWRQCQIFHKSGLLPKTLNSPEKVATVMLMGRELGLGPMSSINNISVIQGKPVLEAKLMLSLVFRSYPNAYYRIMENSEQRAEIQIGRSQGMAAKFEFTIEQAKRAGLLSKDNWRNYPADMLLWRAVARGCRNMFPDVFTVAAHTKDELEPIKIDPVKHKPVPPPEPQQKQAVDKPKRAVKSSTEKILDKLIPMDDEE